MPTNSPEAVEALERFIELMEITQRATLVAEEQQQPDEDQLARNWAYRRGLAHGIRTARGLIDDYQPTGGAAA